MSLIKSHHVELVEREKDRDGLSLKTIKSISQYIINNFAPLIVDIEQGTVHKSLMEREIIKYLDGEHTVRFNRDAGIKQVMDYMFGYGPLQDLIDDEDISDIDVCKHDYIIIKKHGIKSKSPMHFKDQQTFLDYCKLVVIRNGGLINEKDCHARVTDDRYKLRINVTIGPRNITGPSMTIRKHRDRAYSLRELEGLGMMDGATRFFLERLMTLAPRLVIVGKGASGKTTLLRALLKTIGPTDRFLVCESDSELYPDQANFIVQRVQANHKQASLDQLIKDGLTMSLDGYCIGELVGTEVSEFLKAGYTDHRIMGTLHAQGIEDTLSRIRSMLSQSHFYMNYSYIAGALDIIIYMKSFKIMGISELTTINDQVQFNHLMTYHVSRYRKEGVEGYWNHQSKLKYRLSQEWQRRY